jgi:hypothetical protein
MKNLKRQTQRFPEPVKVGAAGSAFSNYTKLVANGIVAEILFAACY